MTEICCVLTAGMPNGTIARREVPTLPVGSIYCLNEKAWFNEQIMLDWIKHPCPLCCNGATGDHPHPLLGPV
jgi:hypothetical protein